ncbi:hypothetical protein F511_41344 [Dorcoceras hygrometricum]|uniref:Transposase (Putative), gypsy type n=1 Tax=Dorcoceras hygrometricum TaxID=472368 RepID=A0A2Z7BIX8_9LAMI|nr:hypothetical protein F511_41344 [Dorcoceras hygrometricum]
MFDNFEVILPGPDERAHRPPWGFHTFYVNQLEMDLRFPLLRFIAALCQHIKISPSKLAPNSYYFLLALAILIRYHNLPLIPYVLMQLIQIKRLGPGKFYLSHKGDHAFIKRNPSSQKGWMSRFFFVKRVGKKRDPWKCDMFWRDNIYTFTPRTPDQCPNLDSFLDVMREKSYNAPELIQEDLLCFFGFIRRGIELVGDLDKRMGKEEMLNMMEEEVAAGSSGAAVPPKKGPKKRRASREEEEGGLDDRPKSPPVVAISEASSPKKKGPGRVPPLDYTEDSLVASPSEVVATRYICNMAPDRDIDLLRRADDSEAAMASGGGGEVHTELLARLEELEALRAQEQQAAEAREEALGDQLAAEKAARETTKSELDATLAKKTDVEVELEETKAHADEKVGRLKSEVIHAWDQSKEEFLQSSEFDTFARREEEHPASFLDAKKALMELPDEEAEEEEEEEEEQGDADATPPSSPI